MESASGPLDVATEVPPLAPDQSSGHRRINFLDLPSEVKNLIYYYLYRDRTKRAINLCVLSPAWKSPSPPTALMNTCSTIASKLMPVYFSNCLSTIDEAHTGNAHLLAEAFKWLKKVGDKSSAQFRRLHIVYPHTPIFGYEINISITKKDQVTIEELKGPAKYLAWRLERERAFPPASRMRPEYRALYSRLDRELTEDLVDTLTRCIKNNETGSMGVTEFEIILQRIDFHMTKFMKRWRLRMA